MEGCSWVPGARILSIDKDDNVESLKRLIRDAVREIMDERANSAVGSLVPESSSRSEC